MLPFACVKVCWHVAVWVEYPLHVCGDVVWYFLQLWIIPGSRTYIPRFAVVSLGTCYKRGMLLNRSTIAFPPRLPALAALHPMPKLRLRV